MTRKIVKLLPVIHEDFVDLAMLLPQIMADMESCHTDPDFIEDFQAVVKLFDDLGKKWDLQILPPKPAKTQAPASDN